MTFLLAFTAATPAAASDAIVNEFYRAGTFGTDEWIEVLLLRDLTAAELEGFFFGDSTSATAYKSSGYHLTATTDFGTVFYAGTLLVLGGAPGGAVTSYDPAADAWTIVLPVSDAHVVSNGTAGDFASEDLAYVDTNGTNRDATLSAAGFAVSYDVSPGVFAAIASVTLPAVPNTTAAALTGDPADAASAASWTIGGPSSFTPGAPNPGANALGIDLLRCGDADGDGVCRFDDVCPGGDDGLDTDADGAPDDCDPCPIDALDDRDGDGTCDSVDTCFGSDDGADADGDGVPDGCDACPADVPPEDDDHDGVCNSDDVCPGGNDANDLDGDGTPNTCDACPLDVPPDDDDGDLVCDSDDACAGFDDTIDADADGVPDACDACPLDPTGDSDGDGVCDSFDTCAFGDDTVDADGDGLPDDCDACPGDPAGDSDGDGVCDGSDACPGFDDAADADGDGIPDGCEGVDLAVGPVAAGQQVSFEMSGLVPGEIAFVFVGGAVGGPGPCYAALGGLCLDLGRHALWVATIQGDATGTGTTAITVPAQVAVGRTFQFQGLVVRGPGGSASVKTPVVPVVVGP